MIALVVRNESVRLSLIDDFSAPMARAAGATALFNRNVGALSSTSVQTSRSTARIARDVDGLGASARTTDRSINQLTGRLRLFADIAAILGPGLIPIGAVGIPAVTGLANQLGVAALAGGVAIAAFQGVGDALSAVNEAALDPTQENLAKAAEEMERLSPAARALVLRLKDLGPILRDLRDTAATGLFPGVIASLDALETRVPEVERIIESVSTTLGDMLADGAESLASNRWDDFFNFLATEASDTLTDLGSIVGDLTHGLAEMWQAFDPLNDDFSNWMVRVADSFDDWATGLSQTQGFADFMDYLRETGPQVADTLGALGDAVLQIIEASAPLGGPVLKGLEAVADVISAIADSDLGTPIMTGVAALALLNRTLAVTRALTGGSGGMFAGIGTVQAGVSKSASSLRADLRDASDSMVAFGANTEKATAATGRLRSRLSTLGKGAGVVGGLALATSGLAEGMGVSNTASMALMGTIAGPWGSAIGGGVGLMMDFAAANDDAEDAIKRASAAAGNASSFTAMATAVETAGTALADYRDQLEGATRPGAGWDPARDFAAIKNAVEGLFGDSDVEEFTREVAKAEHALGMTRLAATILAKELGGGTMIEASNGTQILSVSTQEMQVAMERALPVAQRLFPEIVTGFADIANLSPDQITQLANEIQRLDSEAGRVEALGAAFNGLDSNLMGTAEAAGVLKSALDALIEPEMNQERALLAWNESIRNLNDDLAENSRSLSRNTDEGQQNREAVLDRVDALVATVTADAEAGRSSEYLAKKMKVGRAAILDAADAAGLNRGEVEKMINEMNLTPENIKTIVDLIGDEAANRNIRNHAFRLEELDGKTARTRIENTTVNTMIFRQIGNGSTVKVAGQPIPRADGGTIPGPRSPYGDKVLAILAPGEEVITNRNGEADAFRRDRAAGHIPAYADGGMVASERVYTRPAPAMSQSMTVAAPQVAVSLDGLAITGTFEIGGDGLGRIIDGRISAADRHTQTIVRAGGS